MRGARQRILPASTKERTIQHWLDAGFQFEQDNREFNIPNALGSAQVAALSYMQPQKRISDIASAWGFDSHLLEGPRHVGFVFINQDIAIVAFRGTDNWGDWLTNINFLPSQSLLGSVHRGFMTAAESLRPTLVKVLSEHCDRNQSVWFSGHSLGGTMAILNAVALALDGNTEIGGVYTFGQPAVGSMGFRREFATNFKAPYFRLINNIDVVPRLFTGLFRVQVGTEYYIDGRGRLWHGDAPWSVKAWDSFRQGQPTLLGNRREKGSALAQVASHGMGRYLSALGTTYPTTQ